MELHREDVARLFEDFVDVAKVGRRQKEALAKGGDLQTYIADLREQMQKYVGIIRVKEEIAQGIEEIARLRREAESVRASGTSQYNAGWHTALDLRNLLISAEAVARAGLLREESRGAHTRLDFEGEQEEWGKKNIIVRRGENGEMEIEAIDRPEMPEELSAVANAKIEDLEKEAAANV